MWKKNAVMQNMLFWNRLMQAQMFFLLFVASGIFAVSSEVNGNAPHVGKALMTSLMTQSWNEHNGSNAAAVKDEKMCREHLVLKRAEEEPDWSTVEEHHFHDAFTCS